MLIKAIAITGVSVLFFTFIFPPILLHGIKMKNKTAIKLFKLLESLKFPSQYRKVEIAVISNNIEYIQKAISEGLDVTTRYHPEQSLLMFAAALNHFEMIQILSDAGAILDGVDSQKETSLIIAAGEGHIESVEMLISLGADPDLKNINGMTALDIARKFKKRQIIHFLKPLTSEYGIER